MAAVPLGPGTADIIESKIIMEKARVKSPAMAAILGFFAPSLGALYTGKILAAVILFGVDVFLWLVGGFVAEIPPLIYRIFFIYQSYKWAKDANTRALEKLTTERR